MSETTCTSSYSLAMSEDKMLAVLEAYAPIQIDEQEVRQHIEEEGVIAGVDSEAVRAFVDDCTKKEGMIRAPVAKGTKAENGKDGEIRWAYECEQSEDTTEHDRIDWYEQSDLISVAKDALIAEVLRPTEGRDGVNILGEVLEGKDGKPATLSAGPNVRVSDDGARFSAAASGMLVIKGKSVKVDPVYKVKGDVDFETGNIDFDGQVAIGGNVLDLFRVNATGDITIKGCVEAAILESKGDITIKGGVSGKDRCVINLDGDLTAYYINSARVECKGDVLVSVEVLNSRARVGGALIVKQKGIIGGRIVATHKVECNALGSMAETPTEIVLGRDSARESRLSALRMKDVSLSAQARELAGRTTVMGRVEGRLPADRHSLLTKMLNELRSREAELEEVRTEVHSLMEAVREILKNASIVAREMIYPGVVIEMDGVRKEIFEAVKGPVQVKFDLATRQILLLSKEP